jgi:hypothetical protein
VGVGKVLVEVAGVTDVGAGAAAAVEKKDWRADAG